MVIALLLVLLVIVVALAGRPPDGPAGPTQTMQLEAYLHTLDRRQRQLRQGRLTDW